MEANEMGCYVVSDEFATFLQLMNNYSKSDQASIYLKFWSNLPTSVDRVSSPIPLVVQSPFLGIIGSLQPRVIPTLFPKTMTNNGFLQRILFAYPECAEKQPINDNELPTGLIDDYSQWIENYRKLNQVEIDTDGNPNPKIYYFNAEGKNLFYQWQSENTDKVNAVGDSLKSEILTKFDIHFIRLCLILQIMDDYSTNQISLKIVEGVIELCKYFENCSMKVLDILENNNPLDVLPENKSNWFESLPESFTTSDEIRITKHNKKR